MKRGNDLYLAVIKSLTMTLILKTISYFTNILMAITARVWVQATKLAGPG